MSDTDFDRIERAARDLLAALDRMHGAQSLSQNVLQARARLRELLPLTLAPRDKSKAA